VLDPVAREFLQERELHALRGVLDELGTGPPRGLDPAPQIVDLILRYLDRERRDLGAGVDRGAHHYLPWRSVLNAARISLLNSSASPPAAKCPPFSTSLK